MAHFAGLVVLVEMEACRYSRLNCDTNRFDEEVKFSQGCCIKANNIYRSTGVK